ncbi:zinc-regulated protein 8 [Exaiptasia diaphana]|uniref:Uncharacterized protein n=1 Tax=Exaiptasia diaphana TaxID=2652724 RepID=A0A913WRJ6_EXADI|nr:zinc-regulated protein 8 [Exaiptasia diaphana]KXJ05759.1 hypothetical protein AC249_AIPGENE6080 [Exaiptasia diaphana]
MKKSIRKSRKYNQRKSCIDSAKEKELKAFEMLTKDHMSSDDDDESNPSQWFSRPPSYRSEKLKIFLNKLDRIHMKRSNRQPKFTKRVKRVAGEEKDIDPPAGTPTWAISQDWLREKEVLLQEEANDEQDDREEQNEDNDVNYDDDSDEESDDQTSEMDFEI